MKTLRFSFSTTFFVALVLVFSINVSAAATSYTMIDLGTARAFDLNNSGQVTGQLYIPAIGGTHAYLNSDGVIIDLGTLGGTYSVGYGINNLGQVTGNSLISGNTASHAFVYSDGGMTDLGSLPGYSSSRGVAINDNGQVTGFAAYSSLPYQWRAFLYSDGAMTDLGTLGGTGSQAFDINNGGAVVGASSLAGNSASHAFLYLDGVMTDLGTLGGNGSAAYAINTGGQIVGLSQQVQPGQTHAFLYSAGQMLDLGTLGGSVSEAWDINDGGQIVGRSWVDSFNVHGFIYEDGVMTDLNLLLAKGTEPGWTITEAYRVNEAGQILVSGSKGGNARYFLLEPSDLQPIPLPASFWLLGSGLVGLMGSAWRRGG